MSRSVAPERLSKTGFLVTAGTFWAWLLWTCAEEWTRDPDYAHGWVALPLAGYFLATRLARTRSESPFRPGLSWLVVAGCGAVVFPIELGRQAPLYWNVFTWAVYGVVSMATFALANLRGGPGFARASIFPAVFVATAIPWPTLLEQPLTLGLARSVASVVGEMLPVLGIPATIEGTVIVLPACAVGIEDACSGVRSLQSAFMVALAVGELLALGLWRRLFLLPVGFVVAMGTNLLRTLALSMAGAGSGKSGLDAIHDPAGWGALALLLVGIGGAGWLLRSRNARETEEPEHLENRGHPMPTWRWVAVAALVGIGIVAGEGWYAVREIGPRELSRTRLEFRESEALDIEPLPEEIRRALHPTKGDYWRLRRQDAVPVTGYHLVWDNTHSNSEALYHRPDVCMPGVGWSIAGPVEKLRGEIAGEPVTWTALPYEKDGVRALMLWTAWLDGEPLEFSLHSGASVQQNVLMRLIENGRRKFSYEVAAVLLPYEGGAPPVRKGVDAAAAVFELRGKAGSR